MLAIKNMMMFASTVGAITIQNKDGKETATEKKVEVALPKTEFTDEDIVKMTKAFQYKPVADHVVQAIKATQNPDVKQKRKGLKRLKNLKRSLKKKLFRKKDRTLIAPVKHVPLSQQTILGTS